MERRTFLPLAGTVATAAFAQSAPSGGQASKGRLKQGVCRWCYAKMPIEELAAGSAKLGLQCMDLVDDKEWPVLKKHGITPTIIGGSMTIENGLNRKENHDALEKKMRDRIQTAADNNIPSIIVFSGNRKGMPDQEGAENCIAALNRIKKFAEDKNVLVVMELLNSKVNHKDYMCDHTAWGVQVVKEVASPKIKLLYDIYHMQIMEGDLIRNIRDNFQYIGHFHTGGNPGRNEIDNTQEIYYPAVARAIADLGYTGYFSHEFIPKRDPLASLAQAVEICTV